jgi:hypothetical protein
VAAGAEAGLKNKEKQMAFILSPGPGADALAANFADIRRRMAEACRRAGRNPDDVRLVAVSKTYSASAVRAAAEEGQRLFGENRVQEAAAKIPACPDRLEWHLIGHLQGNKAAAAVRLFDWIHSVDSVKLVGTLERHAADAGKDLNILLEVNVSGEAAKSGCKPEELGALVEAANRCPHLVLRGLMTVPPVAEDPEEARPHFRRLRELRDLYGLEELSMGMTHDFPVAIEEGATFIRVGTALFGARG